MKKFLFLALFFALGLFVVESASAQTVSGFVSKGVAKKGRVTRGYVVLKMPGGIHVNSYRPRNEYLIATRVSVSAVGAKAYGVTYPPGKMRKYPYTDKPISVYEGRAVFGFKLSVPKGYRGRYITVKARVRYQACTDEVCYRPRTKTINIRARVR